jgi:hypothetical protein
MLHEPANWTYHLTTAFGLTLLVCLYIFGVWSRSYVLPTPDQLPIKRQLIAAIPIGLITMGAYAKSAFGEMVRMPDNIEFDLVIAFGYAIIFGMLSRESLERILKSSHDAIPPTLDSQLPPNRYSKAA